MLLLGIDGGDRRVVDVLREGGYLPNLNAVLDAGAWGTLDCAPAWPAFPCYCPPVWTSIATGQPVAIHGMTEEFQPASERKVKALWSVLAEQGGRSALIGYRNTWPPEATASVVITEPGLEYAASKLHKIPKEADHPGFRQHATHTKPERLFETLGILPASEEPRSVRAPVARDRIASQSLDRLVGHFDPADLTLIVWHSPDKAQHMSWDRIQANPGDPIDAAALLAVAKNWSGPVSGAFGWGSVASQYLEVDAWLGEHLNRVAYDYVVVASDHGMGRNPSSDGVPGHHYRAITEAHAAIFGISGPGIRPGSAPDGKRSVLDVAPTLAYLLQLPIGEDLPGAVMSELFEAAFLEKRKPEIVPSWE